jgi:hypothetical protein
MRGSFKRTQVVCEFPPRIGDTIYLPDEAGSVVQVFAVGHMSQSTDSTNAPTVVYYCENLEG